MNSKKLKLLERKYFSLKLNQLISEEMVLENDYHQEVISFLNNCLIQANESGFVGFTNKAVIKTILLDKFPFQFFFQSDVGSQIYVSLLSYYDFLYTEKLLTKEEYVEMLLFFQGNMYPFFQKLAWVSQSLDDEFPEVFEELNLDENDPLNPAKRASKNNVIKLSEVSQLHPNPKE